MNPTSTAAPVVLVVGGSQGIGRSIGLAHARQGDRVVAVARTAEVLASLKHDAAAIGLTITTQTADITDDGAPQRVVDAAIESHGRIDAIVYAAATTAASRASLCRARTSSRACRST